MKALILLLIAVPAFAADMPAPDAAPKPKVKYRASQEVNFEQLVIDGQLRRPELSVVTGESGKESKGLLRLRDNFSDQLAVDAGEEIQ